MANLINTYHRAVAIRNDIGGAGLPAPEANLLSLRNFVMALEGPALNDLLSLAAWLNTYAPYVPMPPETPTNPDGGGQN